MRSRRRRHLAGLVRPRADFRLRAAGGILRRKHEQESLANILRQHCGDAEAILHRVAETVTVALVAGIDERAGARPLESHQRVVSAPGVDHVVEFRVGSADGDGFQQSVPVGY